MRWAELVESFSLETCDRIISKYALCSALLITVNQVHKGRHHFRELDTGGSII